MRLVISGIAIGSAIGGAFNITSMWFTDHLAVPIMGVVSNSANLAGMVLPKFLLWLINLVGFVNFHLILGTILLVIHTLCALAYLEKSEASYDLD